MSSSPGSGSGIRWDVYWYCACLSVRWWPSPRSTDGRTNGQTNGSEWWVWIDVIEKTTPKEPERRAGKFAQPACDNGVGFWAHWTQYTQKSIRRRKHIIIIEVSTTVLYWSKSNSTLRASENSRISRSWRICESRRRIGGGRQAERAEWMKKKTSCDYYYVCSLVVLNEVMWRQGKIVCKKQVRVCVCVFGYHELRLLTQFVREVVFVYSYFV